MGIFLCQIPCCASFLSMFFAALGTKSFCKERRQPGTRAQTLSKTSPTARCCHQKKKTLRNSQIRTAPRPPACAMRLRRRAWANISGRPRPSSAPGISSQGEKLGGDKLGRGHGAKAPLPTASATQLNATKPPLFPAPKPRRSQEPGETAKQTGRRLRQAVVQRHGRAAEGAQARHSQGPIAPEIGAVGWKACRIVSSCQV